MALVAATILVACGTKAPYIPISDLDPKRFEAVVDGDSVALYTIHNSKGMEVSITNLGARIVSIMVPDRDGKMRDVALGFDNIEQYIERKMAIGGTVGRFAGRIPNGKLVIDGKSYELTPKDGKGNTLHGGAGAWHNRPFKVVELAHNRVTLSFVDEAGTAGFPGELALMMSYRLSEDENALEIDYRMSTSEPTAVNLTNHTFFNLTGDSRCSIDEHIMRIDGKSFYAADPFTEAKSELRSVEGTTFDYREARPISSHINDLSDSHMQQEGDIDHAWVLNRRARPDEGQVYLHSPSSGITMRTYTTQPLVHISSSSFLDGSIVGKGNAPLIRSGGICVETQHHPISIGDNTPHESTVLRPGELYQYMCIYTFSVE